MKLQDSSGLWTIYNFTINVENSAPHFIDYSTIIIEVITGHPKTIDLPAVNDNEGHQHYILLSNSPPAWINVIDNS